MNFLQLCNRLRQNAGVSGSDLTSVTGQSGESLRVINWINESWMDLQAQRQDWLWLRKSIAFPTVANQYAYTPAQAGIADFGAWDRETFRNYQNPIVSISIASPAVVAYAAHLLSAGDTVTFATTGALPTGLTAGLPYYVLTPGADSFNLSATLGGTAIVTSGTQSGVHTMTSSNTSTFAGMRSEIFMGYSDYDVWRNTYLYGALRTVKTRPNEISITPLKALALGPVPDAGYTVVGDYYSVPSELVLATDIPALPVKYHLAIVYKAMVAYGMYESAAEVVQRGQMELDKWMRRITDDQMPEVTAGGALA